MGCSKAPEQLQSSARPICHSHAMTRTGRSCILSFPSNRQYHTVMLLQIDNLQNILNHAQSYIDGHEGEEIDPFEVEWNRNR